MGTEWTKATVLAFEDKAPKVAESAFLAPTAVLIGDVEIGENASVWFGVVLRGDLGPIRVGADSNVQDNVVIHAETEGGTVLEERVSVGHGAILHDAYVERNSMIGIGAILLEGCRIGSGSLVAAGSVVREGFHLPDRTLAVGVPAAAKRAIEGAAAEWVERGADDYLELCARYRRAAVARS